jgi:hypothetical protein
MQRENDSGMNEAEYFEYLHTPEAFLKWMKENHPIMIDAFKEVYFRSVGLPDNSKIKGL